MSRLKSVLKTVFPATIPVMTGYLVAGIAFGLVLQDAGYGPLWALLISAGVYAGSMQFVMVGFFGSAMTLPEVAVTTLLVNSRHAFYGLSFLDTFKRMGRRMYYMIFSLTDETYSVLCSRSFPEGREGENQRFAISLLDQCYWVAGSLLGSTVGSRLPFDTTGVDFAMTALFLVIFTENCLTMKNRLPIWTGAACGLVSLLVFGPDRFILPAMILAVGVLMALRGRVEAQDAKEGAA